MHGQTCALPPAAVHGGVPIASPTFRQTCPTPMRYSLVIFDLDGTLADSLPWFQRHMNDVADRFGFRRIGKVDFEPLRRAGTREILQRLQVPRWKLPMIAWHMRRLKAAHLASIALFPGAGAALQSLKEGGLSLALVTSD